VIEVLHVAHIYEVYYQDNLSLDYKTASNLVELSVLDHQFDGIIWKRLLENDSIFPKLLRLGIYNVRTYRTGSESEFYSDDEDQDVNYEYISLSNLSLYSRLEAVAAPFQMGFVSGGNYSQKELILLPDRETDSFFNCHPIEYLSEQMNIGDTMQNSPQEYAPPDVEGLLHGLCLSPPRDTTFFFVPFPRSKLSSDVQTVLSEFAEYNVEVHYLDEEEEDSISIIPNSFVDFVRRQKKKEEDGKEKKNADE